MPDKISSIPGGGGGGRGKGGEGEGGGVPLLNMPNIIYIVYHNGNIQYQGVLMACGRQGWLRLWG